MEPWLFLAFLLGFALQSSSATRGAGLVAGTGDVGPAPAAPSPPPALPPQPWAADGAVIPAATTVEPNQGIAALYQDDAGVLASLTSPQAPADTPMEAPPPPPVDADSGSALPMVADTSDSEQSPRRSSPALLPPLPMPLAPSCTSGDCSQTLRMRKNSTNVKTLSAAASPGLGRCYWSKAGPGAGAACSGRDDRGQPMYPFMFSGGSAYWSWVGLDRSTYASYRPECGRSLDCSVLGCATEACCVQVCTKARQARGRCDVQPYSSARIWYKAYLPGQRWNFAECDPSAKKPGKKPG